MHLSAISPNTIAHPGIDNSQSPSQATLMGFYSLAVLFNLCLVAQVLTAGLADFAHPDWWNTHVWLVRSYSGLSLALLIWVYRVPFPQRIRMLTLSLSVLLGLQFLSIHPLLSLPIPLAILHPLIGFTLFYASTNLVHRVRQLLKPRNEK